MTHSLIYITAASREEALKLARTLVQERLLACANVVDNATSVYWWDGAVQEEGEALMLAKTLSSNVEALIARVRALHSYTCPCVVAVPIVAGNPAYLDWIAREAAPG